MSVCRAGGFVKMADHTMQLFNRSLPVFFSATNLTKITFHYIDNDDHENLRIFVDETQTSGVLLYFQFSLFYLFI